MDDEDERMSPRLLVMYMYDSHYIKIVDRSYSDGMRRYNILRHFLSRREDIDIPDIVEHSLDSTSNMGYN